MTASPPSIEARAARAIDESLPTSLADHDIPEATRAMIATRVAEFATRLITMMKHEARRDDSELILAKHVDNAYRKLIATRWSRVTRAAQSVGGILVGGAISGLFSSVVKSSTPGSSGALVDVVEVNGAFLGLMGALVVGLALFFWSLSKE